VAAIALAQLHEGALCAFPDLTDPCRRFPAKTRTRSWRAAISSRLIGLGAR
jgi:hypothetical protein